MRIKIKVFVFRSLVNRKVQNFILLVPNRATLSRFHSGKAKNEQTVVLERLERNPS